MAARANRPTQLYLRPDQIVALRGLSERRGVSVAALVREGVDSLLASEEESWDHDPLWKIVGIGCSSVGDGSERLDEHLVQTYERE